MGQFIHNVQVGLKNSSTNLAVFLFRSVTGLFVGTTMSLIVQELIGYGTLAFWLVVISLMLVFLKVSKRWKAAGVFIFNLVFILFGLLLRMYILIAPGT